MRNNWYKKSLIVGIIVLFVSVSIATSTGKIDSAISRTTIFDGSLLGYVNDTSGNPIEGALVRVYFHEDYEEDYSDSTGYYHVTNIPICYCLKNATCSKGGYKTEWVLLGITENTTHDFILTPNHPPGKPYIHGKWIVYRVEIECYFRAIDPDGDEVIYHIDWGDGTSDTTGFNKSNETVSVRFTYPAQGTYTITVYAEDIHGAFGPENTYTPMGKNKAKAIEDKNSINLNSGWDIYRHFLFGRIYNLSIENESSNHVTYEFESENIWGLEITRKSRTYGWEIEIRFYHHKGHVYWHFSGIKFRGIIEPDFICGYFHSRY